MPFIDSLDIGNRTCQHLGATRISSPQEDSVNNAEISFAYDKLRRAELRRNAWRFAIKRAVLRPIDTTSFLLEPAQWDATVQYLPGSVVADANGYLWVSNKANNIGNDPNLTDQWDGYYGGMSVDAYDATGETSYFAGDLVYIQNANSSYNIYLSMQNDNTEVPNVADAYDATITYQQDSTVTYLGIQYRSLIALNLNNTPVAGPPNWSLTQTYTAGAIVTGADGYIYTSQVNGNLGNVPTNDDGTNWINTNTPNAWTALPTMPVASNKWTPLYAALVSFNFVYPIGVGPRSQNTTRNIFRLPANYLRMAQQNPKNGVYSFLGAPTGNYMKDWVLEGDFLLSQFDRAILFRFVADVVNVREMDDMFCEGLAARMAYETCEYITNSSKKKDDCMIAYNKFMGEARIVNGIENGPTEPPEDDFIACRV